MCGILSNIVQISIYLKDSWKKIRQEKITFILHFWKKHSDKKNTFQSFLFRINSDKINKSKENK